jgi:hypothetical protein
MQNAHLWLSGAVVGGLLLRECVHTYRYIFFAVLNHDKSRRGLDHDHPSVNQLHMHAAGAAGALAVGVPTYLASAYVLERALRPTTPDPSVLFDAPPAPAPRLTLAALGRALSPRVGTRTSTRAFFAAHGGQLMARGFAFAWAFLVLAPAAQATCMGHFAHVRTHEEQRASFFGRAYRADTDEDVVDFLQEREARATAAAAAAAAAATAARR